MVKYSAIATFTVVFAVVAHLMVEPSGALVCSDIDPAVKQCGPYVTGAVDDPSAECCSEVKRLSGMARTATERRQLCSCLKQSASQFRDVQLSMIATVPQKCGVSLIYFTLDLNNDCNYLH